MSVRRFLNSAIQVGAAAAAVYGTYATLRRIEERTQNAQLGNRKRFLILGCGFAGAAVAKELARLLPGDGNGEIVVVDEDNYLLFTPMLTEAAGGELQPSDIVSPARHLGSRIRFVQGRITSIDIQAKTIKLETDLKDLAPASQSFTGDQLVIALGSVVNFHNTPGVAENSIPMKRLEDARHAFEHVSACLERANVEHDETMRRELLTFVVGGGGYTGVETMAAINDLVRSSVDSMSGIRHEEVRTVIVHPGDRLLPEITPDLAAYATSKLKQRGVEVVLKTKIAGAGPGYVELEGGKRIAAYTLIWAAGVTPNPLVDALPIPKGKHHGIVVEDTCQVRDHAGVWALGDCAEVPEPDGKGTYAPTAQNATRQGKLVAQNIVSSLRGESLKSFRFTPIGELALVGRHSGVARVYGRNFSGPVAWAMWRAIYLAKMPNLPQRCRILSDWLVELLFGRPAVPLSSGRAARAGK